MADCNICAAASSCERVWKGINNPMCVGFEPIVTNADRIRHMADDELALFLNKHGNFACDVMGQWHSGMCSKPCSECWLDWLKQEAKE